MARPRKAGGVHILWENLTDEQKVHILDDEPDNAALARTVGKLPSEISEERDRLLSLPTPPKGVKGRGIDGTPTKKPLRVKARKCQLHHALFELLDNIFDNYDANGMPEDLDVEIRFYRQGGGEVRITENSGGVSPKGREAMVRPGESYRAGEDEGYTIGTWGEGFKIAAFALGSRVRIHTHFPDEAPHLVDFGEGWLDRDDWQAQEIEMPDADLPRGTTILSVTDLHPTKVAQVLSAADTAKALEEISRKLAQTYADKLNRYKTRHKRDVAIRLRMGNDTVDVDCADLIMLSKDALDARFAFVPRFHPVTVKRVWGNGKLEGTITVGLTPHKRLHEAGVWMWGNGRQFVRALHDEAFFDGSAILRFNETTDSRLQVLIWFAARHGDDIPWQGPLKEGFDYTHDFAPDIKKAVGECVHGYLAFTRLALGWMFAPFCEEWNGLPERDRLDALSKSKPAPKSAVVPKAVKTFVPSPIEEVTDLPSDDPRFEGRIARELASSWKALPSDRGIEVMLKGTAAKRGGKTAVRATAMKGRSAVVTIPVTIHLTAARLKRIRQLSGKEDAAKAVQALLDKALYKELKA